VTNGQRCMRRNSRQVRHFGSTTMFHGPGHCTRWAKKTDCLTKIAQQNPCDTAITTISSAELLKVTCTHGIIITNTNKDKSVLRASYLGSQHDAIRSLGSGAGSRQRSTAGTRRQQLSIDICCPRPSSAAKQPHVAAAVDRRDRQTDGHPPIHRPCIAY